MTQPAQAPPLAATVLRRPGATKRTRSIILLLFSPPLVTAACLRATNEYPECLVFFTF